MKRKNEIADSSLSFSAETLERRSFLKMAALAAGSTLLPGVAHTEAPPVTMSTARPVFPSSDAKWQRTWDAALAVLASNIHSMPRYEHPVLVEGAVYPGIWQECGPQEGLVYGTLGPFITLAEGAPTPMQVARNNHMIFFALQKEDGQLPSAAKLADQIGTTGGYGQIQMVVPIAATAWEVSQLTGDDELLVAAYNSCSK